jgi:hypothetical protein
MNCPNCSNTIDSKTRFCPYCDAPVEDYVAASLSRLRTVASASVATGRSPVVNRYVDLYRTARVMTGLGTTVKTVGIVAAAVIFLFWFIVGIAAASQTSSSPFAAQSSAGIVSFFVPTIIGVIFGALVGGLFFLFGVLISAQGQLLMAHADSAVHTSPFLSDKERAVAMSLPYTAPATAGAVAD